MRGRDEAAQRRYYDPRPLGTISMLRADPASRLAHAPTATRVQAAWINLHAPQPAGETGLPRRDSPECLAPARSANPLALAPATHPGFQLFETISTLRCHPSPRQVHQ